LPITTTKWNKTIRHEDASATVEKEFPLLDNQKRRESVLEMEPFFFQAGSLQKGTTEKEQEKSRKLIENKEKEKHVK
jgi:hypothetical protein